MNDLSLAEKLNILFGVFMVLIYFAMGFFIVFSPVFLANIDGTIKILLGITIIIYAFYRIYRIYVFINRIKKNNTEIDDDEKN